MSPLVFIWCDKRQRFQCYLETKLIDENSVQLTYLIIIRENIYCEVEIVGPSNSFVFYDDNNDNIFHDTLKNKKTHPNPLYP